MHHHRGPIRIGIGPQARRAQCHQGIGPSGLGTGGIVFSRHPRHSLGRSSKRPCHHRPRGRGKLRGKAEAPAVVGPPPRDVAGTLGIGRLLDRSCGNKIPSATDGRTRDPCCPGKKPFLGLGGGEPAELHDLVDRQVTGGEGLGDPRQVSQGMRGRDPAKGLPVGDPVAHGQPVGHVSGTPVLATAPGDHLSRSPRTSLAGLHRLGHGRRRCPRSARRRFARRGRAPRPHMGSRGRRDTHRIEHMFESQADGGELPVPAGSGWPTTWVTGTR